MNDVCRRCWRGCSQFASGTDICNAITAFVKREGIRPNGATMLKGSMTRAGLYSLDGLVYEQVLAVKRIGQKTLRLLRDVCRDADIENDFTDQYDAVQADREGQARLPREMTVLRAMCNELAWHAEETVGGTDSIQERVDELLAQTERHVRLIARDT